MNHLLEPSAIRYGESPERIGAIVGSSLVVTLWNATTKKGGMAQFELPSTADAKLATARFGNAAIYGLARSLSVKDEPSAWEAQLVGAAKGDGAGQETLVAVARRVLARLGVAVVSEDIGGQLGRKLVFDLGTGEIAISKVRSLRASDWHEAAPRSEPAPASRGPAAARREPAPASRESAPATREPAAASRESVPAPRSTAISTRLALG